MNLTKFIPFAFPSNQRVKSEPKYSPLPSPAEMFTSQLPEKSHQGRKVAWDLSIRSMHGEVSRSQLIVLTTVENSTGNIWITVDTNQFPDIYYCSSGTNIRVKGEVSLVKGEDIYLNNCQIGF